MKIKYKLGAFNYFEVDGNCTKILETDGELEYILHWLRDKLRKLENGQIKVFKNSEKRNWEEEENIKKHLWENIKGTEERIVLGDSPTINEEGKEMYRVYWHPSSYESSDTIITACTQEDIDRSRRYY